MKKVIFAALIVVLSLPSFAQSSMPTLKTEINLIPDSIVIRSNTDTSYLIVTNGNGFLTKSRVLFEKIMDHMLSDTIAGDGIENYVLIEGTSMGPLANFYRKEVRGTKDKKRALELNGYLYRLTGYKLDYHIAGQTKIQPVVTTPPPVVITPPSAGTIPKTDPKRQLQTASNNAALEEALKGKKRGN